MSRRKSSLDNLQIPKPCPVGWDRMAGNERVRYCGQCDKHVYNLSKMTRSHAEAIVSAARGQLCARITRGADGIILTEEARPALHLISRRASPVVVAVVTALLGVSGSASPGAIPKPPAFASGSFEAGAGKPQVQPQAGVAASSISGTVTDITGAVIAGARVNLSNPATGESQVVESSDEGGYGFASLTPGTYNLSITALGFTTLLIEQFALQQNEDKRLNPVMEAQAVIEMGGVVALSPPEPLRQLYFDSELIVVATVGESVSEESADHGDMMKTALHISSTIRGKSKKRVVYVQHWQSRDYETRYPKGESILFFLDRPAAGDGEGYKINQEYYGLKKLPAPDLSVYIQRMRELESIGEYRRDNAREIVEWLVRCAEDPATRWEGAYELSQSAKEKEPELAALLTDNQKERLMSALFKTDPVSDKEVELIALARMWRDERLAPYLVSQLRRMEDDPSYFAGVMMREIGEFLEDEKLSSLAEEYGENASFPEHETEPEESEEPEEPEAIEESRAAEPAQEDESPKRKEMSIEEARHERSAMVKGFLSAVEKRLKEISSKVSFD